SDLLIVVASPLKADDRSQQRLLDKIAIYLRYVRSPEYEAQCGPPSRGKTCITVHLHPDSDGVILDLLERCRPWVAENLCDLRVILINEPVAASSNQRLERP